MDGPGAYLFHLLVWILPFLGLQWIIGWRIFIPNWRPILFPTLLGGTFFSLIDVVAVREGIWFFDPKQNLGWFIGPLPFEEVLFFFLTSLLVAQSIVLLLPEIVRYPRLRG